jgi:C-terminal processing protease CtpA/Prc
VITAIDGRPAALWFPEQEALTSGSPQWRADRVAVVALTRGPEGTRAVLELERPSATLKVELTRTLREPVREVRPEQIAEVRPGVWYVDLERADWSTLQPRLTDLARAKAVIFDVRGYPSDAGMRVLPYLLKAPDPDRWMHVPCIVEPFGRVATWQSRGWNLAPASPHLAGRITFLTDARAISYAESVMGYVEALGLGTIVGSATAGTNGNVNPFSVPSGMTITFTGMRVTRHDGSPFHLVGVQPDVPVEPTAAGVRAGRDEVLERALAAARP